VLWYGFSKRFSVGVMVGYDRLISIQYPNDLPTVPPSPLAYEYMALKLTSADLMAWYHFPPTMEVRPYVYLGVGGAAYLRQGREDKYIPNGTYKVDSSVHVPLGFGFEIPTSQHVSFAIDFGARIMDDYTDHWKGHSTLDETTRSRTC